MPLEMTIRAIAGTFILASVALGWFVSPYWLLLTAFVGVNLMQSAFTGFCPAAIVFRKLGLREGCAFADKARP
jgi:hypothetical protein